MLYQFTKTQVGPCCHCHVVYAESSVSNKSKRQERLKRHGKEVDWRELHQPQVKWNLVATGSTVNQPTDSDFVPTGYVYNGSVTPERPVKNEREAELLDNWDDVKRMALAFAEQKIRNRVEWKPEAGSDAESIAADAIATCWETYTTSGDAFEVDPDNPLGRLFGHLKRCVSWSMGRLDESVSASGVQLDIDKHDREADDNPTPETERLVRCLSDLATPDGSTRGQAVKSAKVDSQVATVYATADNEPSNVQLADMLDVKETTIRRCRERLGKRLPVRQLQAERFLAIVLDTFSAMVPMDHHAIQRVPKLREAEIDWPVVVGESFAACPARNV